MDVFITVKGLQPIPVFSLDQKGCASAHCAPSDTSDCVAGGGPLNNVAVSFCTFVGGVRLTLAGVLPLLNALIATAIMIYYVRVRQDSMTD